MPFAMTHPASESHGWPRMPWPLAILFTAYGLLLWHAWGYLPFIADDALISLRYAKRLLQGHGLTFTPGEAVEGYSNLLWVLLNAAGGLFHDELVDVARVLGLACSFLTLAALLPGRSSWPGSLLACAVGTLFLACSGTMAVWSIGGLEQPLVAALLAWITALLLDLARGDSPPAAKRLILPGILAGLLCLTRPDGPLFVVAFGLGFFLLFGRSRRTMGLALFFCGVAAAFVIAQLVFRLSYYGDWLPNTAYIKVDSGLHHFRDGLRYVGQGAWLLLPALGLAILLGLLVLRDRDSRRRLGFLILPALLWSGYLVSVGGDIFPAFRHFTPLVVLLAFVIVEGVEGACHQARPRRLALVAILGLGLLSALWIVQHRAAQNLDAAKERWEWDGKAVGLLLKRAFGDRQPLLAVDAAGCVPYWSELPTLDMLGLMDRVIARTPKKLGGGTVAHEHGNGAYVLSRQPDIILFGGPNGSATPIYISGIELVDLPGFSEYTLVYFRVPRAHDQTALTLAWVRIMSPRIGVRFQGHTVTVPGFLLNNAPTPVVRMDDQGRLGTVVSASREAGFDATLAHGRWRVTLGATNPNLRLMVIDLHDTRVLAQGSMTCDVEVGTAPGTKVHVAIGSELPSEDMALWLRFERL